MTTLTHILYPDLYNRVQDCRLALLKKHRRVKTIKGIQKEYESLLERCLLVSEMHYSWNSDLFTESTVSDLVGNFELKVKLFESKLKKFTKVAKATI